MLPGPLGIFTGVARCAWFVVCSSQDSQLSSRAKLTLLFIVLGDSERLRSSHLWLDAMLLASLKIKRLLRGLLLDSNFRLLSY